MVSYTLAMVETDSLSKFCSFVNLLITYQDTQSQQ